MLVLMTLVLSSTVFLQVNNLQAVEVKAIKSYKIYTQGGQFFSDVVVLVEKEYPNELKVNGTSTQISVQDVSTGRSLHFGDAAIEWHLTQGAHTGEEALIERIRMGKVNSENTQKILEILSIFGDPSSNFEFVIHAHDVTVGFAKGSKKWSFQENIRYLWKYTPRNQRNFILE
jgi:hypothetical protein